MRECKKKKNAGFSLIELLVAVMILAVVFIPIMHSFVTAARTNTRAKRKMEATTVGQNVFEKLKASTVEDFAAQSGAAQTDTGLLDSDGQPVYRTNATLSESANGQSFEVDVTLDPQSYTTLSTASGQAATDYNSVGWSELSSLAAADNAFLILEEDDAADAAAQIQLMDPGLDAADIESGLERHIDVGITHSDSTNVTLVKATVSYTYLTYTYLALDQQDIYNNGTEPENVLKNVYICYYPMYNNQMKGSPTESITIDNTGNYPVGVFVIRQAATVTSADAALYSVDLEIQEGARDLNSDPLTVTTVTTNMEYSELSASNELRLTYSGNAIPSGKSVTDVLAVSEGGSGGLARTSSSVRIYKVTIDVYEQEGGARGDLLTTIEGTKIE